MELRRDGWYRADKGKRFVLTEKGKAEVASYSYKTVGEPVSDYDYEAVDWAVDDGYLIEVDIPGWTTLNGYEVVYYNNGYRLHAGNAQTFPTIKAAEAYKKHYESYPWWDDELFIEEVEYEGVPLSEPKMFNGKIVVDEEHYFGLDAHEIGEYFSEEKVNDFMDMLPPACWRSDCAQIGEPVTSRIDENGEGRATYSTFKKIADGIWEYCGDCFRGENVRRGTEPVYA